MLSCRVQLKLWIVGFCGLGWLWISPPAMAQLPISEAAASTTPRSGHNCYDLASERPEPLGEFRQALLETAAVVARAADTVEAKSEALVQLSTGYACLGQVALAKAIAQEAVPLLETLEDPTVQGRLLVTLAGVYGAALDAAALDDAVLDDAVQRDGLLVQAIALADVAPQDSAEQYTLIDGIIRFYIDLGDYEKIRAVVDIVDDFSIRQELIQTRLWFVQTVAPEDEQLRLLELFPELAVLSAASSTLPEEIEFSPLQAWLFQFYQQGAFAQGEERDEFMAAQVLAIERFPDLFSQAYGYIFLGSYLWTVEEQGQALASLELAAQIIEDLPQSEMPDEIATVVEASSIGGFYGLLGATFVRVGDLERGLSILRRMDSSPDHLAAKVSAFIETARVLAADSPQTPQVDTLMLEAAQTARLAGNSQQLLEVAFAYVDLGNAEAARRLADEIFENLNRDAPAFTANYLYSSLTYLLFEVGSYEKGMAALAFVDEQEALSDFSAQLIRVGEEDLAWQVFDRITSPVQQVQSLTYMIETYQGLDQSETALTLAVRAVETFNTIDFTQEEDLVYAVSSLGEISEGEISDAERDWLIASLPESTLDSILYSFEGDASTVRALIAQVKDDALRNQAIETFLPEDVTVTAPNTADEQSENDDDFSRIASTAASEARFQAAVDAVAMMASGAEQFRTLLNIAKCHAYSTTVLDATTAATLAQIQQRYE